MIKSLINATRYAIEGIVFGLQRERALAIEIFIVVTLLPVTTIIGKTIVEKLLLLGSLFLVLIVEFLNTAVEKAVDHISTEYHPLAKIAKDCGAAAVFLSIIFAILTWILILFYGG